MFTGQIEVSYMPDFAFLELSGILHPFTHENIRVPELFKDAHQLYNRWIVSRKSHWRLENRWNQPQQKTAPQKFDGFLVVAGGNDYFVALP